MPEIKSLAFLIRKKTCPQAHFLSLIQHPEWADFDFYSFQVGTHETELVPHQTHARLHNLSPQIDHFLDTAWLIQQMDRIISVDTAVAHLAGALDKPVSLLLSAVPYWFWSPDTDTSPWYANMRIFRQTSPNDWNSVFEALRQTLKS